MQDEPSLAELLESAWRFLDEEVVPAMVDQRLRFRARVASNLLSIAVRELSLEKELLEAERDRLEELLGRAGTVAELNSELARRIRAGEIDVRPGNAVWAHLRRTAVEKLRIANPAYLKRAGEG